jgi:hypothetical protein
MFSSKTQRKVWSGPSKCVFRKPLIEVELFGALPISTGGSESTANRHLAATTSHIAHRKPSVKAANRFNSASRHHSRGKASLRSGSISSTETVELAD